MATIEDFMKLDIRVGKIIDAKIFEKAKRPAYQLKIDFGSEIGVKKSSAQITEVYKLEDLIGKQILKDNAINQSAIAKAIDVERKTVGSNNPLVAKFIDKHSTNEPKGDVSGARYSALQKELAEFKAQYDAMVSHIVDIENVRAELKVEKDRVAEKEVQIANFEKENAELRVALDKYRRADMDTLIKYSSDSRNKS